jgi:hypothetical protein
LKELDLKRHPVQRIKRIIDEEFGGYAFSGGLMQREALGIGGLRYVEHNKNNSEYLRVYIERYNQGLGIRFRNFDFHKLMAIKPEEVVSLEVNKPADIISPRKKSLFLFLRKRGWSYPYAKIFLFEEEIIEEHEGSLSIAFESGQRIEFIAKKRDCMAYVRFFERTGLKDKIINKVEEYQLSF